MPSAPAAWSTLNAKSRAAAALGVAGFLARPPRVAASLSVKSAFTAASSSSHAIEAEGGGGTGGPVSP